MFVFWKTALECQSYSGESGSSEAPPGGLGATQVVMVAVADASQRLWRGVNGWIQRHLRRSPEGIVRHGAEEGEMLKTRSPFCHEHLGISSYY